jgi:hypothetical protein
MPSKSSPAFFGFTPGDEAVAAVRVVAAHARVELAVLPVIPCVITFVLPVDEDAHCAPFAAATTFCAASAMLLAVMIGRPDAARILRPELLVGALHAHDQRDLQADRLGRRDDALLRWCRPS